jgi:hypothetical protein
MTKSNAKIISLKLQIAPMQQQQQLTSAYCEQKRSNQFFFPASANLNYEARLKESVQASQKTPIDRAN